MLIHVDSSGVADATSGSAPATRSRACIENLLLAHFEGNHVVSLLPEDAAILRALPWSVRARRALDHIDESYAQIAGLREDIPWSLELGLGPSFDDKVATLPNHRRVIRAPLHAVDRFHKAACSLLLGENLTDAELFVELGAMRRAVRRWERLEMIHHVRGSGGSTFGPECAALAATGVIFLAIADGDRRHPNSPLGGTYLQLQEAMAGRPEYQRARPLPTRTAEGLVPLVVYREVFASRHGDSRLGTVDRLEALLRSAPADAARYAHFKRGISLHQVENPVHEAEGKYWGDIAKNARRDRCNLKTSEQCTKREECKCFVVDGLGEKALADVVAWMKTRGSKKQLAERFNLAADHELCALADEVLAWGLALQPLLT